MTELPIVPLRRDDAFSAGGKAGKHPFAAIYRGEYETPWDGTAIAVRAHARALSDAGIPVLIRSISHQVTTEHGAVQPRHLVDLSPSVAAKVGALEQTTAEHFWPVIHHLVVRDGEHLKRIVLPRSITGTIEEVLEQRQSVLSGAIVYSVWERDRVDPSIAKTLARVAECWVPSTRNRNMLIASGVPAEKVVIVPHPFEGSDLLSLRSRKPAPQWRKFYSIGRWEPRKGYAELIEAFLRAFQSTDRVVLTIKYTGGTWPGYPKPDEAVEQAARHPESRANGWTLRSIRDRVRLIEGRFPRSQVLELHYRNNLYVASSHGEAWCLPAFEAGLAGNPVVYVPSGGVEDFLPVDVGHVMVRDTFPVAVPESYHWESDARWTGYEIESLMEALRQAEAPSAHQEPSRLHYGGYTMAAIGELMRDRIMLLARDHAPRVAEYYGEKNR